MAADLETKVNLDYALYVTPNDITCTNAVNFFTYSPMLIYIFVSMIVSGKYVCETKRYNQIILINVEFKRQAAQNLEKIAIFFETEI